MQHSDKPHEELQRAEQALEAMRSAANLDEFEEHWKEFLRRVERVWSKMISHFGKSPKWSGWSSPFEHSRRTDPLLSYLVNARGAEEHTVNDIVARDPGGIGINPAFGDTLHIKRLEQRDGQISVESAQPLKIDFIPAKTRLLPVVNRGRTYAVPSHHLDKVVDSSNVLAVAEAALAFYRGALKSGEAFFVK